MQEYFFISKNKAKKRLEICKNCNNLRPFVMMCTVCHCFMPIKVTFPSSRCPIGKWGIEEADMNIKDSYRADKEK